MKCPFCGSNSLKVLDSRSIEDGSIRRRRTCEDCGKRFTTYERIEMTPLVVIKKDNTREPFDRNKIIAGMMRSCMKRPVATEDIRQAALDVENTLANMDQTEIPASVIGEMVMDKLKVLDEVAYVRFASVYREFTDVDSFMEEVSKIIKKPKTKGK